MIRRSRVVSSWISSERSSSSRRQKQTQESGVRNTLHLIKSRAGRSCRAEAKSLRQPTANPRPTCRGSLQLQPSGQKKKKDRLEKTSPYLSSQHTLRGERSQLLRVEDQGPGYTKEELKKRAQIPPKLPKDE